MKITTRGWARDMGAKEILSANLAHKEIDDDEVRSLERGRTYFKVSRDVSNGFRGRRKVSHRVRVFGHAELNQSGSYLVQLELSREDIARLFYLTSGDQSLPELLQFFSNLKTIERVGVPHEEA